jgi:hypothetical protein
MMEVEFLEPVEMGSYKNIGGIGCFYIKVPKLFPWTEPTWTHVFNQDGTLAF